jgi:hypothetical protein
MYSQALDAWLLQPTETTARSYLTTARPPPDYCQLHGCRPAKLLTTRLRLQDTWYFTELHGYGYGYTAAVKANLKPMVRYFFDFVLTKVNQLCAYMSAWCLHRTNVQTDKQDKTGGNIQTNKQTNKPNGRRRLFGLLLTWRCMYNKWRDVCVMRDILWCRCVCPKSGAWRLAT